ncbi:MAG TPA: pyridoxine 5'-phosphate synthase [Thermoanaerobaculia bacterium]|nr:pyridoxine 5'-phosphate synthase [Thermoanaerobaculia bacterium]
MARLSVNVDHIATLRQARRTRFPDPVEAAWVAEEAGASGITVHLRMDRRHIQDSDVERLREGVRGKLNLEMSISAEMLKAALRLKPHQVTLVPERPEEVTTEGGLNLIFYGRRIAEVAEQLAAAGIGISLFIDPEPRQLQALSSMPGGGARWIEGFEINTDAYTRATEPEQVEEELAKIREMADLGKEKGLQVYAGHGLRADNVGPIAAIPNMEELNIGHSIVARSVMVGMEGAVKEMLAAMNGGKGK